MSIAIKTTLIGAYIYEIGWVSEIVREEPCNVGLVGLGNVKITNENNRS